MYLHEFGKAASPAWRRRLPCDFLSSLVHCGAQMENRYQRGGISCTSWPSSLDALLSTDGELLRLPKRNQHSMIGQSVLPTEAQQRRFFSKYPLSCRKSTSSSTAKARGGILGLESWQSYIDYLRISIYQDTDSVGAFEAPPRISVNRPSILCCACMAIVITGWDWKIAESRDRSFDA